MKPFTLWAIWDVEKKTYIDKENGEYFNNKLNAFTVFSDAWALREIEELCKQENRLPEYFQVIKLTATPKEAE